MLKNRITAALILFRQCCDFLLFVRQRPVLEEVCRELLQPALMKFALFRVEIWVVLHVFLEALTDEELKELLKQQLVKGNFNSLRLLVSLAYLFPLQSNLNLKRYFVQLSSQVVKPFILDLLEEGNQMVLDFMETLVTCSYQESLIFSAGLKSVVRQAILECGNAETEEQLFEVCVVKLFASMNQEPEGDKLMRMSITLNNLLPEFGHLLKERLAIFQQATNIVRELLKDNKLEGHSRLLFEANLQVVAAYWAQEVQIDLVYEP